MAEQNAQKAVTREKIAALRKILEGIEAPIADLAASAFSTGRKSNGDGFINNFQDSWNDINGGWTDAFADAPSSKIEAVSLIAESESRDITLSVLSKSGLENINFSIVAKTPTDKE
jgi:hypothetical protein